MMKMNKQRIATVACFGSLLGLVPSVAEAAVYHEWVPAQALYSLAPGESVSVEIFLQETVTDGDVSLLAAEDGLGSIGLFVQRLFPDSASPTVITDVAINSTDFDDTDFSFAFIDESAASASVSAFRDLFAADGVVGEAIDANTRQVAVGSFTLTAGSQAGVTDTFGLFDPLSDGDTATFTNGVELDDEIASGQFVVEVVPEPAGLLGVAMAGLALATRRRRA